MPVQLYGEPKHLGSCQICKDRSPLISTKLGVCLNCIRSKPDKSLRISDQIHRKTRHVFGLPPRPSTSLGGLQCGQCANNCVISEGQKGFCGLVENQFGKLKRQGGTAEKGILEWYYDPLPTNCVSWWFCPGCTGAGYPKFSYSSTAEMGYSNLAVFYGGCSTDCLFCQNWHHRVLPQRHEQAISAEKLASRINKKIPCICFFGGDPSTHMPHALKTSQIALEAALVQNRILRLCWETNGRMLLTYATEAARLSLESGGNMKFDIKAWDENLSKVLCGTSNKTALQNFRNIGDEFYSQRPELPLLSVSTLLVPGYIDTKEIENIAKSIANVNPKIPYTLLAFSPAYIMNDLPTTSREYAHNCYAVAKKYLENVRVGNDHLLS
ncbi:MAG: radical SAM protein [Candidatus Bathyarchaeota archaeon]|nr:MAG: radical SAM protein [Candidatus Bathyarchaeota archaeon]